MNNNKQLASMDNGLTVRCQAENGLFSDAGSEPLSYELEQKILANIATFRAILDDAGAALRDGRVQQAAGLLKQVSTESSLVSMLLRGH
jgi:hypothetical protein